MHYLIYLSLSSKSFSDDELEQILIQSRENNKKKDITGLLLYCKNNFMQILEGSKADVYSTYQTITEDPRHSHLIKIYDGPLQERNFSDWSMAFKQLPSSELPKIEGFRELNRKAVLKDQYDAQTHPAFIFLRSFLDTNLD